MSNLLTLQNARDFVGRFVENGSCNSTTIDKTINEAVGRLMVKADWPHTTQMVRIRCNNQTFPLPRECDGVRWANIENNAAGVFPQTFEFMASGPGEIQHRSVISGFKDLIDAGNYPLMYDIPPIEEFEEGANCTERTLLEGWKLVAFSTAREDAEQSITLYGTSKLHNEIGLSSGAVFSPGETLQITQWQDGTEGIIFGGWDSTHVTTNRYRHLISWKKPVTRGYVTLLAVDTDTNYTYVLAKAHPDDTVPTWRRYKISGQAQVGDCANILALVKMKALTLSRPDDILPIQNLYAIKLMVIAIREENSGALQNAAAYEASATRILSEQLQNNIVAGGMPKIVDYDEESAGARINQIIF